MLKSHSNKVLYSSLLSEGFLHGPDRDYGVFQLSVRMILEEIDPSTDHISFSYGGTNFYHLHWELLTRWFVIMANEANRYTSGRKVSGSS